MGTRCRQYGEIPEHAVNGLADREREIRSTVQTRFRTGSMNKAITAVAIMLPRIACAALTRPVIREEDPSAARKRARLLLLEKGQGCLGCLPRLGGTTRKSFELGEVHR